MRLPTEIASRCLRSWAAEDVPTRLTNAGAARDSLAS